MEWNGLFVAALARACLSSVSLQRAGLGSQVVSLPFAFPGDPVSW